MTLARLSLAGAILALLLPCRWPTDRSCSGFALWYFLEEQQLRPH